jgi:hypothetical protein
MDPDAGTIPSSPSTETSRSSSDIATEVQLMTCVSLSLSLFPARTVIELMCTRGISEP